MYIACKSRPTTRTWNVGNIRRPALVTIISVPCSWNLSHNCLASNITDADCNDAWYGNCLSSLFFSLLTLILLVLLLLLLLFRLTLSVLLLLLFKLELVSLLLLLLLLTWFCVYHSLFQSFGEIGVFPKHFELNCDLKLIWQTFTAQFWNVIFVILFGPCEF